MGGAQAAIIWPVDTPVRQGPADLTTFGSPSAGPATERTVAPVT